MMGGDGLPAVVHILLIAVPAIAAIILHELAHGYMALALGDDTAKQMGRLSFNPIRHVDRVGTLLLPGLLILGQLLTVGRVGFVFGWAKPVPVAAFRFANPRRGMAIVAVAGPLANFALAWLAALTLHLVPHLSDMAGLVLQTGLENFILVNLVLGLFNLLPIPPLDGGRIMVGLLPLRFAAVWARLEKAGIVLVVLVVFLLPRLLAEMGVQFDPVNAALSSILPQAWDLVFRLAGLDG